MNTHTAECGKCTSRVVYTCIVITSDISQYEVPGFHQPVNMHRLVTLYIVNATFNVKRVPKEEGAPIIDECR